MPEATVHTMPIRVRLECPQCFAAGEGSCRCGVPYVAAGDRAAAAVAANPERSDRAIAADIGVNHATVSRARNNSTVADATVQTRTGRDGRRRRAPAAPAGPGEPPEPPRRRGRPPGSRTRARQTDPVAEQIATLADHGMSSPEIAASVGVEGRAVRHAIERDTIRDAARRELLDQLGVDPQTLAMSAQARLAAATRAMEHRLSAEHAARMRGIEEEVRQRVLAQTAERLAMLREREAVAHETETVFHQMMNNHQKPFTREQFITILMCLHPDGQRTPERLQEAFRLFNEKKLQLTGER